MKDEDDDFNEIPVEINLENSGKEEDKQQVNKEAEEALISSLNFNSGLHVIIITYDEAKGFPEVELGDVSPWVAITMVKSVFDALDYIIPGPKITYQGATIFDPHNESFSYIRDDDDDDDPPEPDMQV